MLRFYQRQVFVQPVKKQPWLFCAISHPEIKRKIRLAAEEEEKENYNARMSERWKKDLAPLGIKKN